jgi:hypothetical protein
MVVAIIAMTGVPVLVVVVILVAAVLYRMSVARLPFLKPMLRHSRSSCWASYHKLENHLQCIRSVRMVFGCRTQETERMSADHGCGLFSQPLRAFMSDLHGSRTANRKRCAKRSLDKSRPSPPNPTTDAAVSSAPACGHRRSHPPPVRAHRQRRGRSRRGSHHRQQRTRPTVGSAPLVWTCCTRAW